MQVPIPESDFRAPPGVAGHTMHARAMLSESASWPKQCRPDPGSLECSCGLAWSAAPETSAVRAGEVSHIFTDNGYMQVEVFHRKCPGCASVLSYDGGSDAIFNLDNINLFAHELLRRYCFHYLSSVFEVFQFVLLWGVYLPYRHNIMNVMLLPPSFLKGMSRATGIPLDSQAVFYHLTLFGQQHLEYIPFFRGAH